MKAKEAVVVYKRTESDIPETVMRSSADVAEALRAILPDGPQERFVAMALDNRNRITAWTTVAMGGGAICSVEPGIAFRWALIAGASQLIFAHNHPSGDCAPSADDDNMTERLVDAGKLLGVKVLDHVILGNDCSYSYCDHGKV